ncbi:MAG: DUF2207 domain-containing protein [Candidatus Njordarchaeia archaeon]
MFKKMFVITVILLSLFSILGFQSGTNPVSTQLSGLEKASYYDSYNSTIIVNMDASFTVTERMKVNFTFGSFTHGYREIPYTDFDKITNVELYELLPNNITIKYTLGSNLDQFIGVHSDYTYDLSISSFQIKIIWWFPEINASAHWQTKTFILKYRLTNALDKDFFKDRNYVYWYTLPQEHPYIKFSQSIVVLPKNFSRDAMELKPEPDAIYAKSNETKLVYNLYNIGEKSTKKVYISFPTIVNPPFSPRKALREYALFVAIILISTLSLAVYGLHKRILRSHVDGKGKEKIRFVYTSKNPPKNLDPTEAYVLKKYGFGTYSAIITLFQLAGKGLIKIGYENESICVEKSSPADEHIQELSKWEETLYEFIESNDKIVLNKKSKKEIKKIAKINYKHINESLVEKGYIRELIPKAFAKSILYLLLFIAIPSPIGVIAYIWFIYEYFLVFFIIFAISVYFCWNTIYEIFGVTPKGLQELYIAEAYTSHLEDMARRGLVRIKNIEKTQERLDFVFSKEFAWLIAFTPPTEISTLIQNAYKALEKKWRKEKQGNLWFPIWLNILPLKNIETTQIMGEIPKIIDEIVNSITNIIHETSQIFQRSIETGPSGLGGLGGFDGAGGGGTAGFG